MEACQRCGKTGNDRRTLWMACFYAMDELPIPFEQISIQGKCREKIGERKWAYGTLPKWGPPIGETVDRSFFTLRVCKDCRAEWLRAIEKWFNQETKPQPTGTGVFVRSYGTSIELTEEEIDAKF